MLYDWAFVQNSHIDDAESVDSESEEVSLPSLRGRQVDDSDDEDSSKLSQVVKRLEFMKTRRT